MKLHYTPGSPFARIIRVLLRELACPCEEAEVASFPPSAEFFSINPLGQVPALETSDGVRFPTSIIISYLMALPRLEHGTLPHLPLANSVRRQEGFWRDDQLLAVLFAMGDSIVVAKYQEWAGLGPVAENLIGYDPADRHLQRVARTLDWLEEQASPAGFLPRTLSVQDIVLSCLVLWTEARGGLSWRGRPNLEAIVASCAVRPSFVATPPQPWQAGN